MKKRFILSVSDFAIASPLSGSIDNHSGYSEGKEIGSLLHKEIQAHRQKEFESYISEVSIKHTFKYKGYHFEVRGRIDGIYRSVKTTIEEIKSAFNLNKLQSYIQNQIDTHPFCLQLLTYGYFHWLKNQEIPLLNLHLVSSRNKKTIDVALVLEIKKYEIWLEHRLNDLVKQVQAAEKRIKIRRKLAKKLVFPFSTSRPGQNELIVSIQNSFTKKHSMLIQAPTGLGKTIGILFPSLKEALTRGQKVIYVTPKNSQHLIAQQAVKKLQEKHDVKAMTITAKSKLCLKSQVICNSEFCEFAKNYYTKVTENKLITKLNKVNNLSASNFKKIGLKYEVCPFELQMDNIVNVDAIICDYNYVFSPQSGTNRVGKMFLGENDKPNLIIDEFHNLPERAMSYYSPSLSTITFKNWYIASDHIDLQFKEKYRTLLAQCSKLIENSKTSNTLTPYKISPPINNFKEMLLKIKEFLAEYLESEIEIRTEDLVLSLFNCWAEFTDALEFVDIMTNEFFTSYYPKDGTIKITCCDASTMLQRCYDPYHQIIGFSATLKPFKFYSQLSGLDNENLKTIEFPFPFLKSQRKIMVIPQVSSKYSERSYHYPRIVEVINKISNLKKGNYFVFFPSFDFLENVLKLYPVSNKFKIISQKRNMSFSEIQILLDDLKNSSISRLIFAVQGGVLAEGIDYPGDMMIGAMIVGVPLPKYDWEREQMKLYYEEKYKAGVDYAYTFPAMAKSIQSSGRVIRSESDTGLIVLMDPRFLLENYANCMPKDWFENTPEELISKSILNDIKEFWKEIKEKKH